MIAENLQQVMDWPAVLSPPDLPTEIPPVLRRRSIFPSGTDCKSDGILSRLQPLIRAACDGLMANFSHFASFFG